MLRIVLNCPKRRVEKLARYFTARVRNSRDLQARETLREEVVSCGLLRAGFVISPPMYIPPHFWNLFAANFLAHHSSQVDFNHALNLLLAMRGRMSHFAQPGGLC